METWDEMNKRHDGELENLKNLHNQETQEAQEAGETEMYLKMLKSQHRYVFDAISSRQVSEAKNHTDWEKGAANGPSINRYLTAQEAVNMELNDLAQWQLEQRGSKGNVTIEQFMEKSLVETPVVKKSMMEELREVFEGKKPGSQELER